MILEKLVLENFRQFYGRQEIVFGGINERNITVIHAENGFGKTTLLNAFLWVLYGSKLLTSDFEKKYNLISERVVEKSKDSNTTFAKVELSFLSGDKRIIATRTISLAQQNAKEDGDLVVMIKNSLGRTTRADNDREEIRALVPPGIANFLFFNGENIDKYATEESADSVSSAIRNMMGLELLQRTIQDLEHQNVRGKFVKELSDNASGEKAKLIKEKEDSVILRKETNEKITSNQEEITNCENEIRKINAKLEANMSVASEQKRRAMFESQAESHKQKIDELTLSLEKLVNEDGYSIIASALIAPSREMMDQWRKDGQIPAQVLDTFLKDLLHAEKCICQRELKPGSCHRAAVESLLQIAGDHGFNNSVGALDRCIGHVEATSEKARANLKEIRTQRIEQITLLKRAQEEIEEIRQKFGSQDDNTVRELEDKRNTHNISRDALLVEIGILRNQIPNIEATIKDLQARIEALTDDEEATRVAQQHVSVIDNCIETLTKILDAETEELIPTLTNEINKHLARTVNQRGYKAAIDDDFRIKVLNQQGGVVAKNQALRQTLSLCFIGSLIDLSRRRSEVPTILQGLAGSVYPIVMDSPFGSMDLGLQTDIAEIMPELANQVVTLITSSQYNGGVADTFKRTRKVGKRYYLRYHGTELPTNKANLRMQIEGRDYDLFKEDAFEHTQIIEIS
jgi:DNA sulfur modification protein DndD